MDNKFRLHIVPPESSLDLETLVHTGGNVSAKDLRKALEEGKIDQQKYLELLTELLERTEKKLEETELSLGQAKQEIISLSVDLEKSGIDGKTGLLRYEFLEPKLNQWIKEIMDAKNHNRASEIHAIIVMILDVDNFKNFNKKYGHIVGDQVLTVLGQRVRDASKRSGDLLVRYGGDEIVMVYPVRSNKNITDQELIAVVERTRNEINTGLNIKIEGEAKPITVALGHTIYRVGETNATQLIYEADLAQIIEKEEGRKQERIKKAKEGLL